MSIVFGFMSHTVTQQVKTQWFEINHLIVCHVTHTLSTVAGHTIPSFEEIGGMFSTSVRENESEKLLMWKLTNE